MRVQIFVRTATLLSICFVAAISASAQDPDSQQSPDPLAAAARKARAEQLKEPKPKKVFTNDDFPSAPSITSSDAKPADAKPAGAPPAGGQGDVSTKADAKLGPEDDPKQEAYWRKRFGKARAKLAQAEKEVEVLQRQLNKNEVQYYPDPQKALMQQYTRKDIDQDLAKLDAKKAEVENLKKQISDLEDELRRAGGDPGWAR